MIRFFRNLLITLLILAAIAYVVALYYADWLAEFAAEPLTNTFVACYRPGDEDEYGFDVRFHIWPPTVDVENLSIEAKFLSVDGSVFQDCELSVDRIVCDLWTLMYYRQVKVHEIEGRKFSGGLTNAKLADRLERTGGALTEVAVDEYNGKARVRGRFGSISPATITILGRWAVDDRGVVTLVDRQYRNPDSPVPYGAIVIIEQQTNLDIRIELLDEGLIAEEVIWTPHGLWISAHD